MRFGLRLGADPGLDFRLSDRCHVAEHDVPFLRIARTLNAGSYATLACWFSFVALVKLASVSCR